MTFNVWTFVFEILNFVVLASILHRLLYRPLRDAIDRRKRENEQARTDAEAARKQADALQAELSAKLADMDQERQNLLRATAEQAETARSQRLSEAEAEAKQVRERAAHDAEQLHHDTLAALDREIGTLAVGLAERLLVQASHRSLHASLVNHLVETLRSIDDSERTRVRQDAGTGAVIVESAVSLEDPMRAELGDAMESLTGHSCELRFETRPELVGGALVRIGGHVWDATLAAQLAAARTAVTGGDHGQSG